MSLRKVTVAIATLAADGALTACLRSLEEQAFQDFEVVVVDNSGAGRVRAEASRVRVIANNANVGFGAAINQVFRASDSPYLVALNDDAVAQAGWLETLVACADSHPGAGMFASEVHLGDTGLLDSAGMLIAEDGSSTQRGHGRPPSDFAAATEVLCPSGSAAVYRRKMLEEIGFFDESYFLYCEDTDLGLRARWAGWNCLYVPGAIVEHRYSHSAGRASLLKAYLVERNRLYTVLKNFPAGMLWRVPFASVVRYGWHLLAMLEGQGKASQFRRGGNSAWLLPFVVLRAHAAVLVRLPRLWSARRAIRASRKIDQHAFRKMIQFHHVGLRNVAMH